MPQDLPGEAAELFGGLIVSESSIIGRHRASLRGGFTLIEAVAALAVASIALLALLHLQLVSIHTADKAQVMTRAVLLAQEKMAEALSAGYPPMGTKAGTAETCGDQFTWRVEVTDAPLSKLVVAGAARQSHGPLVRGDHLRQLTVDVSWQRGPGEKRICLTTYVAENRIREG